MISVPSVVVINSKVLQCRPQVCRTCCARFSWLAGPVNIQQRMRISLRMWSATLWMAGPVWFPLLEIVEIFEMGM